MDKRIKKQLKTLKSFLTNEKFYEAQQLYSTLYQRFPTTNEKVTFLSQGIDKFLSFQQYTSVYELYRILIPLIFNTQYVSDNYDLQQHVLSDVKQIITNKNYQIAKQILLCYIDTDTSNNSNYEFTCISSNIY